MAVRLGQGIGYPPGAVVRLTAHTYPRDGSYGSALGNRLLGRLRTGVRLVVSGRDGERRCYRVARRVAVRAEGSFSEYSSSTGRSHLAILACSGKRRGPGDWSHRTIWYAVPTPAARNFREAAVKAEAHGFRPGRDPLDLWARPR